MDDANDKSKFAPVVSALIRLAKVGSSRVHKKSLDFLSKELGGNPSMAEMLSLAVAGADSPEDIAFVNLAMSAFQESTKEKEPTTTKKKFDLFVDDNFHYMDKDERYKAGSFDSYDEAVIAAKAIVDKCLEQYYEPGMAAEKLYKVYTSRGEDPFIVGDLGKEQQDALLARANALKEEIEARKQVHGDNFEELNKPINFPVSNLHFSAWDYARERCDELCNHTGT